MQLIETDEVKLRNLTADGDSFRMRVPVLQAGVRNANKRQYSLSVIKQAIADLKVRLNARRTSYGSTSHVKDMGVDEVSHLVEDVELDEKTGIASAIVRILPTTKGRNLSAIIKNGGAVGVSARGAGDVDADGTVKEGYKLLGIDFTLAPSFNTFADKAMVFESRELEDDDGAVTPLTEVQKADRFLLALSAGYRGSFQKYCEDVLSKL